MTSGILLHEDKHETGWLHRMLDALTIRKLRGEWELMGTGGVENIRPVGAFLRSSAQKKSVITVRDRDYQTQDYVENSWKEESLDFSLHWHEAENYLLARPVLESAFEELKQTPKGRQCAKFCKFDPWRELLETASSMKEGFAGEVSYYELEHKKRAAGDVRLLRPNQHKPKRNLNLASPAHAWREYFAAEALRLGEALRQTVQREDLSAEEMQAFYDQRLDDFSQVEFFSSGKFLQLMPGKELMSTLLGRVNNTGLNISRSDFEEELFKHLQVLPPEQISPNPFEKLKIILETLGLLLRR